MHFVHIMHVIKQLKTKKRSESIGLVSSEGKMPEKKVNINYRGHL